MAKGSAGRPCVKCYLTFALVILIALAATNVWNPFPGLWDWVNRSQPLSDPDVVWQQRLGGSPETVTIAGGVVVVEQRTTVEARSLSTGVRIWERKADWSAVAGGEQDPVVAVGKLLTKGYEVLDPQTGAVRRRDDAAVAVWTFRDALLDVRCSSPKNCTLTAWKPRGTTPLWTTDLPGVGFVLFADNPEVLGVRPLTTSRVETQAGGPDPLPALMGFPVDGRVYIIDTAAGRRVQELTPERKERIAAIGGRMLRIDAISQDGTCYFTVEAQDAVTGEPVWRKAGLNPRTADGAGCVQRHNPQGGPSVLVAVAADMRELILSAYDGRVLWTGAPGEKVVAVNDRQVLVRAADKKSVRSEELAAAGSKWVHNTAPESGVTLTRDAVVVTESSPDLIVILAPRTGRELAKLRSSAAVLATGPQGMIIGSGREIGYIHFGAASGSPDAPGGTNPTRSGPDPGPGSGPGDDGGNCGGPKQPQCPATGGKDG